MSRAIGERLTDSKITQRQIEESRERYRPVAVRGSLLYFTVAELCRVDVMYQYSLDYFKVSGIHLAGIFVPNVELRTALLPASECQGKWSSDRVYQRNRRQTLGYTLN